MYIVTRCRKMSLFNSCFACLILLFQSSVDALILYSFYFAVLFFLDYFYFFNNGQKKLFPFSMGLP